MDDPIIFKKYANRRLYDTSTSKYVTLAELADIIRKGHHVKVVDAKTDEDVSAFILTQIILEQAKTKNTLLPVPLLHLIIQYGDNILLDFFDNYLNQIIENYLAYKRSVDAQFQRWLDLGMGLSNPDQAQMPNFNPFQDLFKGFTGDQGPKKDSEE